jgi:hypothetical protein
MMKKPCQAQLENKNPKDPPKKGKVAKEREDQIGRVFLRRAISPRQN